MDKNELRKKYKEQRKKCKEELYLKIYENIFTIREFNNANSYFIYLSFDSEVETKLLVKGLLENNKIVTVPQCDPKTKTMTPVRIKSLEELKIGHYGILEPSSTKEYNKAIEIAIIPSLAFDKKGNRLGYGAGYYDKFLKNYETLKIGINYDCLLVENLPNEPHDIKMDYLVTEERVVRLI